MYKLILFLGICSAFTLGSEQTKHSKHSEKVVGCYYVLRKPQNDPQPALVKTGIDASLCNYLIYSFVGVGPNGSIVYENLFPSKDSGKLQHFDAEWKHNPQIKTLAHLQPYSDPYAGNMQNLFYDPHMRETIVKNVVNFVKEYKFNGIDLDFVYTDPVNEHTNADRKNLVLLLKALEDEFKKANFILSVSVDPRTPGADMIYDIKGISDYANFINLMPFNSQEPLYKQKKTSVDHTGQDFYSINEYPEEPTEYIHDFVRHWEHNGVPLNKLVLGIHLNRIPQFDFDTTFIGEGQYTPPADPTTCNWSKKLDVDPMKEKARYIKKMKLGGIVVHNLDQDDLLGTCGEKFPVLKALNQVLRNKS